MRTIVERKRIEVDEARRRLPFSDLQSRLHQTRPPLDFTSIFKKGFACIAEVKKASPSRGLFTNEFDPQQIALEYERGGAAAISVLTDEEFFRGSSNDLTKVKNSVSLPVLRKEFIIDEYQILESRALGADAILLISEVLSADQLQEFIALSNELGMAPLAEGHTPDAIRKGVDAGAEIIGVNNRDLNDFTLDLETSFRLKSLIPDERIAVSESGIKTSDDLLRLEDLGYRGALIGETLMVLKDREGGLRRLLEPLRRE